MQALLLLVLIGTVVGSSVYYFTNNETTSFSVWRNNNKNDSYEGITIEDVLFHLNEPKSIFSVNNMTTLPTHHSKKRKKPSTYSSDSALPACQRQRTRPPIRFEVTAKLKQKYKIEYSVKNIHTKEICILILNTMFDDDFWPTGVEVWKGDDIEAYASVVISLQTENISPSSYKRIKSGVTMTVTRDLTDFFRFQANQMDYSFRIESTFFYNFYSGGCLETKVKNLEKYRFVSDFYIVNSLKPEEIPIDKPYTTLENWIENNDAIASLEETEQNTGYYKKNALLNEENINLITEVHKAACFIYPVAHSAIKSVVRGGQRSEDKTYETWFGKFDQENKAKTQQFIKECAFYVKLQIIYAVASEDYCQIKGPETMYAFVRTEMLGKAQRLLHLCWSFFKLSKKDAIITVLHELSHDFVASSDEQDNFPGNNLIEKAQNLAINRPDLAATSAENIAQFSYEICTNKPSCNRQLQS